MTDIWGVYAAKEACLASLSPLLLLVDDDENAREGYAELFKGAGFRVIEAHTAEEALAVSAEQSPDIVVTDIALPGADGFALVDNLRCIDATRGVPVVGMTAHWAPNLRDRAQRASMTAMVAKPCQPLHLLAEVRRVLKLPYEAPAADPPSAALQGDGDWKIGVTSPSNRDTNRPVKGRPMRQHDDNPAPGPKTPPSSGQSDSVFTRKVLVVDDDRRWLEGVVEILGREGYDVRGAEGFREGQRAIEQFKPDVLIVDVRLGEYNGLQLVLLRREHLPDPVALVVSGFEDPVIMREAEQAGTYAFLVKPIPASVLVEQVGAALTSRGKRRWPRTTAPPDFTAIVAGHKARILDVSYGGFLMELPFVPQVEPLDVRLPMMNRTVTARTVWTREEAPGVQLCGAALKIDDEASAAWRNVVDSVCAAS